MSDSLQHCGHQASLCITNSQSLLKLMSIELVMPSNHLILCRPLLLLPSVFPSIRVFSNESVLCISWPKYWSFSTSSSNEYLRLISFRIDWLDLLAIQGILKSLLQHHISKASILWHSAFFLGFPCGSAGKESACNMGDLGSIPGLRRSPGEGKGYPFRYSGLENSIDCIVHGVAKNQTQLSDTSLENNDTSGQKEQVPETQEMSQTGPSNTVFPMVLIF